MKFKITAALAASIIVMFLATSAEAHHRHHRQHHYSHHHHYSGLGHLICGLTQRIYFHIRDESLNLARMWAVKFRHVGAAPGMVVVQGRPGRALGGGPGGHVSRIERVVDRCHAVVTDEKGTYERDICRRLVAIVNPRSGS